VKGEDQNRTEIEEERATRKEGGRERKDAPFLWE
jgi:hypothetical protein